MNSKEQIIKKYEDKVIGEKYNSQKLYASDVSTEDNLISLLYDTLSHEIDINEAGVSFLQEYWGLENIANIVLDYEEWDGDFHRGFKNANEIVEWLDGFRQGRQYRFLTTEEKVKLDIQNAFFKKYGGKKLGGVIDNSEMEYYTSTLMDEEKALDFLVNLSKGVTYLTLTGYEFMNEVYGLKQLANRLFEKYPEYVKKDSQKNLDWLVKEKHSFIK